MGYGGGSFFSILLHEVAKALSLMNCKKKLSKAKLIRFSPKKLKKGSLALLGTLDKRAISLAAEVAEAAQQMRMLASLEQLWFLPYGQYISGVGQLQE